MAGLRDQFQHFWAAGEGDVAAAVTSGLVVPDANVLLNFYRFQAVARDELFGALEGLGERLWAPHQVGLEFSRNRLRVMQEQEEYFSKTQQELDAAIDGLRGKVRGFGARIALGDDQVALIEQEISQLRARIADEVDRAEAANEVRLDGHASDPVLARVLALFENRMGGPMEPGELEAARVEAKRRGEGRIPPGYRDGGKTEGDPAGDYLVFRQLITEAAGRKIPVVLITDDKKPDWYEIFKGRAIGGRRELREEMMREAGVPLVIMTTRTFLLRAKDDLDAKVSPETIAQARELPRALGVNPVATILRLDIARELASNTESRVLQRALLTHELKLRLPRMEPDRQKGMQRLLLHELQEEASELADGNPDTEAAAAIAAALARPFIERMNSGELTRDEVADRLAGFRESLMIVAAEEQDELAP